MFEPVLEHHREEFQRLKGLQIMVAVGTFLGGMATGLGAVVLATPELAKWLWWAWLGAFGLVFVVIEFRKVSVLRRDVRERQESGGAGS
jgi:hypothetical protein